MARGRKLRMFYQRGNRPDYRYIAWFELRGKDFYWGPGVQAPDIEAVSFAGMSVSVDVPEDLDALPRANWKASLHKSGVMHVNTDGSGRLQQRDVYLGSVDDLDHPSVFAALLDKQPGAHEAYTKSLTRGGCAALVLRLSESQWRCRQYFEFFLTPSGTYPAPPAVISGISTESLNAPPLTHSFGPEPDLSLAVRHGTMGPDFSQWRPNVGIWLNLHNPFTTSNVDGALLNRHDGVDEPVTRGRGDGLDSRLRCPGEDIDGTPTLAGERPGGTVNAVTTPVDRHLSRLVIDAVRSANRAGECRTP
jgi:hypothetical protein